MLETLQESRPQIATLYGNYLFILLVALRLKHPSLVETHLEILWNVVKSWVLVQLGFAETKHDEVYGKPKFHVLGLWHNLCTRARVLIQIPEPTQTRIRFGRIVTSDTSEEPYSGLFLENIHERSQVLCGFWNSLIPLRTDSRFRWTLTNHREIVDAARALKNTGRSTQIDWRS